MKPIVIASLGLAVALASGSARAQQEDEGAGTIWGGTHVIMHLSPEGATLEFDCAHGQILQPIKPSAKGEFTVTGTYTPEHGGPIRKDNPLQELPATYKGTISGDTMQLRIVLADKTLEPAPFSLTRGARGRVVKCR